LREHIKNATNEFSNDTVFAVRSSGVVMQEGVAIVEDSGAKSWQGNMKAT
jgi:hypothetical protein